ncbi:hypothetical protein [Vibrio sp. B1Z05]|nr:hypothetical protein [Vibrio sp. B1Z05]
MQTNILISGEKLMAKMAKNKQKPTVFCPFKQLVERSRTAWEGSRASKA